MSRKIACPYCNGSGKCEPTFGARLRALRNDRGLTQEKMAEVAGVTRPQLANLEANRSGPNLASVVQLAEAFSVSTDWLLGRDEAKK